VIGRVRRLTTKWKSLPNSPVAGRGAILARGRVMEGNRAADVTQRARGQGRGTWRAALRPSGATDADVRAAG